MHNAPITFVDETVDFKNLDAVAIQANTKKVLDRTKNNSGAHDRLQGFFKLSKDLKLKKYDKVFIFNSSLRYFY